MKREEKDTIIEKLVKQIQDNKHFYLTDISGLNAEKTSKLRRKCFESNIELVVVKNTLLQKALAKVGVQFEELYPVLTNGTSIMFTETGNLPARLIKDFRVANDKPILKAAYVEESIYVGDTQLDSLASLKSKDELVGDVIGMLLSPAQNVISALQSGKNTIAGVVKTLSERPE